MLLIEVEKALRKHIILRNYQPTILNSERQETKTPEIDQQLV